MTTNLTPERIVNLRDRWYAYCERRLQTQLERLREIGFVDVDCYWKWRELALLVGHKG